VQRTALHDSLQDEANRDRKRQAGPTSTTGSPLAFQNPSSSELKALLQRVKTIAVVGLSTDPDRPSYSVAMYLQQNGYRIVPVRPGGGEILGEKVYATLSDIPFAVDLVDCSAAAPRWASTWTKRSGCACRAIWHAGGRDRR